MTITVQTQAELDKALADKEPTIYIESPAGVWLRVGDTGSADVAALGSAHVEVWGSARVVASDSAHVVAWGSAHVVAWGSAHIEARDSARVEVWGSAHVEASDSARVEVWGSARVVASDSVHVVACGSAHVVASRHVAIHLRSKQVQLTGYGYVIDLTEINLETVPDFLAYHGVKVVDGNAVLYKAVDQNLHSGHGYTLTEYPIGGTVTAPDWEATQEPGAGLHFGYTPAVARSYFNGDGEPRFLEVHVPVEGLVALGDKAKARSCRVVREVDVYGSPVTEAVAS